MDEMSWRAKLAKSNINILNITGSTWYIEFTYHPKPGVFKWCKTFFVIPDNIVFPDKDEPTKWYKDPSYSDSDIADIILDEVLTLRKELEG